MFLYMCFKPSKLSQRLIITIHTRKNLDKEIKLDGKYSPIKVKVFHYSISASQPFQFIKRY